MVLTFAEDFTSNVLLDADLRSVPTSGLFLNRGVHALVTVKNLLSFLPVETFTFSAYAAGTTYGKFETTQARADIVLSGGLVYESIAAANIGNTPASSPTKWLLTNIESLRLKAFIKDSRDNMISALNMTRKLVESQYIYNVGSDTVILPGNFSGWVIEPKGSDYIKIRINEISLQANTTTPVPLYVVNQGVLLTTLTLTPVNGVLQFASVPYEISAKGRVVLAFASQSVRSQNAYNDALKYEGFVCYPVTGIGSAAATAVYDIGSTGNGLAFNISAYSDVTGYVTNNLIDFAKMAQAQFEIDFLRMVISNTNARSTRQERALDARDLERLDFEVSDLHSNTVARNYERIKAQTLKAIERTFDQALQADEPFSVDIGVI